MPTVSSSAHFVAEMPPRDEVVFHVIGDRLGQRSDWARVAAGAQARDVGLGEVLVFGAQHFGHGDILDLWSATEGGKDGGGEGIPRIRLAAPEIVEATR